MTETQYKKQWAYFEESTSYQLIQKGAKLNSPAFVTSHLNRWECFGFVFVETFLHRLTDKCFFNDVFSLLDCSKFIHFRFSFFFFLPFLSSPPPLTRFATIVQCKHPRWHSCLF